MLHKESAISNLMGNITSFSNSNINFDHVPTFTDHVQSSCGLPITTAKPKWCRMVQMDYRPTNEEVSSPLAQLRKRRAPYADLNEEFHKKPPKYNKREESRALKDDRIDEESVGADGHPCWKQ